MASTVEGIQGTEVITITIVESSPNDLPKAKETIVQVIVSRISGTVKGGIGWILMVAGKWIIPMRENGIVAGVVGSAHGNGMPTELGRETGDLEDGGFTGLQDQEGTQGLSVPEEPDQGSVGSPWLGDFTDAARAARYLKHPETYLAGLLIYEVHSSFGTLKEGFQKPTLAKKALWYLLFGNIGTIFMLFTMLVLAPRGSAGARLLVKSMTAAGVLLFGLNLTLLYLKYQP